MFLFRSTLYVDYIALSFNIDHVRVLWWLLCFRALQKPINSILNFPKHDQENFKDFRGGEFNLALQFRLLRDSANNVQRQEAAVSFIPQLKHHPQRVLIGNRRHGGELSTTISITQPPIDVNHFHQVHVADNPAEFSDVELERHFHDCEAWDTRRDIDWNDVDRLVVARQSLLDVPPQRLLYVLELAILGRQRRLVLVHVFGDVVVKHRDNIHVCVRELQQVYRFESLDVGAFPLTDVSCDSAKLKCRYIFFVGKIT